MKNTRIVRLCGACSSSRAHQYKDQVGSLRTDRPCVECGELNWTLCYARPAPHRWFTFWTVFLLTFGLCCMAYIGYLYWAAVCQPFFKSYFKHWN